MKGELNPCKSRGGGRGGSRNVYTSSASYVCVAIARHIKLKCSHVGQVIAHVAGWEPCILHDPTNMFPGLDMYY